MTADTFLAAYTHFGRFDPGRASVATWLTRIAHNRAVNLLRTADRTKRTSVPEGMEFVDPTADPAGEAEASDTVLRLLAKCRQILNGETDGLHIAHSIV